MRFCGPNTGSGKLLANSPVRWQVNGQFLCTIADEFCHTPTKKAKKEKKVVSRSNKMSQRLFIEGSHYGTVSNLPTTKEITTASSQTEIN
jgi:hypothetical protein